jgi:iron complex transport system permease protein
MRGASVLATDGRVIAAYSRHVLGKIVFILAAVVALVVALVVSLSLGAAKVPVLDVARTLVGLHVMERHEVIVWSIRLPQALTAIVAGAGLAIAGAVMQSILRNPLASPFTLGISHAAAFGAAFGVMALGTGLMTSNNVGAVAIVNPWLTTASAFACSLSAAAIVIVIARLRGSTPEVMVLTGVALNALFTAGTMLLQYYANDVQLAAMVFWTFGDVARATWRQLGLIAAGVALVSIYFLANGWTYNIVDAGDETARSLGVRVERVRAIGMMMASLMTAVIISFLGVIGFVGLVVPHFVRRIIGADHRFLLPASMVVGGLLLLVADTAARLMLSPHVLPVSILTAFVGAPVFVYFLVRGRR